MLDAVGVANISDLFADISEESACRKPLSIPSSKSELEVRRIVQSLAAKNLDLSRVPSFLGGGSYDHYIPAAVGNLLGRGEFYTSYTPYQPEVSQGTLQYIFEYQSMITRLTGMEISNASLYDGGTAMTEAALMTGATHRKKKILVSDTVNPESVEVLKTYAKIQGYEVCLLESKNRVTSLDAVRESLDDQVCCVIVQSPNFFGYLEDLKALADLVHEQKKCSFIASVDPMSLGILKSPGELGCDVVVGEAQCFGIPMNFGGPYLGFIAVNKEFLRKIPGRIVGETVDVNGKRSWVLTLSAREQHIKRERATSNICSNQGLNVLAATIYMSLMGDEGLWEVASQCARKARYAYDSFIATGKFQPVSDRPFFKEFTLRSVEDPAAINARLLREGIVGGLDLKKIDDRFDREILFAVTEKRTVEEIDRLVRIAGGEA